jgi:hypothetical protein
MNRTDYQESDQLGIKATPPGGGRGIDWTRTLSVYSSAKL